MIIVCGIIGLLLGMAAPLVFYARKPVHARQGEYRYMIPCACVGVLMGLEIGIVLTAILGNLN